MYKASYGDFEIEIITEQDHNRLQCNLTHCHPDDDGYTQTSIYGIKIYKGVLHKTAMVMATGWTASMGSNSVIIDGESLILTCSNKVFSLQLPDLQLNWVIVADWSTCFGIYQYQDNYIVRGEVEITRIDRSGRIIWQVSARDIFVNIEHTGTEFQMRPEYIELMDWLGYRYKLFYNGTIVDNGMAPLAAKDE